MADLIPRLGVPKEAKGHYVCRTVEPARGKSTATGEKKSEISSYPVLGPQNTLVILVDLSGEDSVASAEEVEGYMEEVANFYWESSYESVYLQGVNDPTKPADIVGPYYLARVPESTTNAEWIERIAIAAADPDVNFSLYDRLIIISDADETGGNSSVGKKPVFTKDGEVLLSVSYASLHSKPSGLIAHELGHGLGFGHANFLDCGEESLPEGDRTACTEDEYGDLYDVMGGIPGRMSYDNVDHKRFLGWLREGNLIKADESGSFVLEPMETLSGGLKALQVGDLLIEFRQPIGNDANILRTSVFNGALIHISGGGFASLLVDATPSSVDENSYHYPALEVGESIDEPVTGATITVTDVQNNDSDPTLSRLSVEVTFP